MGLLIFFFFFLYFHRGRQSDLNCLSFCDLLLSKALHFDPGSLVTFVIFFMVLCMDFLFSQHDFKHSNEVTDFMVVSSDPYITSSDGGSTLSWWGGLCVPKIPRATPSGASHSSW